MFGTSGSLAEADNFLPTCLSALSHRILWKISGVESHPGASRGPWILLEKGSAQLPWVTSSDDVY